MEKTSYRLPLITTVLIAIQMAMGGLIVGKDAGFVCPNWPYCYHTLIPTVITPLLALELVHRLSALLVTVFVIVTFVQVFRKYRGNRLMIRLSLFSIFSLLLQIVVGGLIVIWKLPGATTTIDVMNSMLLLGMYVALSVVTYRINRPGVSPDKRTVSHRMTLIGPGRTVLGAGALAILVGAIFRHTGASEALFGKMDYLASHGQHVPPSIPFSHVMLFLHALTGVALLFSVLWFMAKCRTDRTLYRLSCVLFGFTVLQAFLGMWTYASALNVGLATAHWANASILMALLAWIVAVVEYSTRQDVAGSEASLEPSIAK